MHGFGRSPHGGDGNVRLGSSPHRLDDGLTDTAVRLTEISDRGTTRLMFLEWDLDPEKLSFGADS